STPSRIGSRKLLRSAATFHGGGRRWSAKSNAAVDSTCIRTPSPRACGVAGSRPTHAAARADLPDDRGGPRGAARLAGGAGGDPPGEGKHGGVPEAGVRRAGGGIHGC